MQGSVLGPRLFNIYTSDFGDIIGEDFFRISYADDSYVALSCCPGKVNEAKSKLEAVALKHFGWLRSLGLVVNPTKTEYIIFHKSNFIPDDTSSLYVDGTLIPPTDSMKILGLIFSSDLSWTKNVNKSINSANSLLYAFRYLNRKVTRKQFCNLIQAHFVSRLSYASQVWSGNLTYSARKRLDGCFYKMIRLLKFDFKAKLNRSELLNDTSLRSLRSIFLLRDAKTMFSLCTNLRPDALAIRMLAQGYTASRRPLLPRFFDCSIRKVGKNSFVNRLKHVAELIPFDWLHLNKPAFDSKFKSILPRTLSLV